LTKEALKLAQEPSATRPCRSCGGTGERWTGINEAPTSICKPCNGTGQIALAKPAQDVDYWIREATAARQAEMAMRRELEAQPAQEPHKYDWSMLEAAKESLREHMARIKELETQLAQPEQEPVAHVYLFDHEGRPRIAWDKTKGIKIGDKLYTAPPKRQWIWLSDADIADVIDTTCQYTGSYEEFLIKKAERKIRSMNNG
jgi:hypothetical protein